MLAQETMTAHKPIVLVVEDDPAVRAVLASGMQSAFTLLKARSSKAAIELLRSLQSPPDVVLTDATMTRDDGFELALALKELPNTADVPILMLTAIADRDFKLKALEFGVDDFVTKPFDLAEVKLRVRNLANVHKAKRTLSGYADELEARVAERTAALQEANDRLMQAHNDLLNARAEAIQALGVACEYRDDDTAVHIKRVALYTRIIAENLGLDSGYVHLLETAAPMHDIGKIGVPDHILLKPGKLTPEEFKIMQQHPGIGARILSTAKSPMLREAYDIALYHHEKWDGTGYPKGIRGEEIPISARVVALCDVFDALTQKRVYKPAFGIERARSIIEAGAGTDFDPAIVEAFRKGLDSMIDVCNTYRD
jgi:putative two-component system response regulator